MEMRMGKVINLLILVEMLKVFLRQDTKPSKQVLEILSFD